MNMPGRDIQGMSVTELLDQGEYWQARGETGQLYPVAIKDMDIPHVENLCAWLLDRAPRLLQGALASMYSASSFFSGEAALDSIDGEISRLEGTDPYQWMREQPLFIALQLRLPEPERLAGFMMAPSMSLCNGTLEVQAGNHLVYIIERLTSERIGLRLEQWADLVTAIQNNDWNCHE